MSAGPTPLSRESSADARTALATQQTWLTRVTERIASSRAGIVALALAALAVYVIQTLGWPLQRGRDAWDYFIAYLSLGDTDTPFALVMLMRPPLTALTLGAPLDLGGAWALEAVAAIAFVITILAWVAVARWYSGLAAIVVALVLLAMPTVGLAFHEASSDFLATMLFALYALALVGAWRAPGLGRYATVGVLVAALALARPAYQVLALTAALPLLARGPLGDRLRHATVLLICAVVPLAAWAGVNEIRYGEFTVSRAGTYNIPFYTAFRAGEIEVENGPASRRLGDLIEQNILTLPPYQELGVDVDAYLESRSNLEAVRLAALADRIEGVGSDYDLLADAAREVTDDGPRLGGVSLRRALDAAWELAANNATRESRVRSLDRPAPSPTVVVEGGGELPNPILLGIPEGAESYGLLACAGHELEPCVIARPGERFATPELAERYTEVIDGVRTLDAELGTRAPRGEIARVLDGVVRRLPPPWLWAVVAAVALAVRRPLGSFVLVWLGLVVGGMLVVHAAGVGPDLFYALPVLPAWVVAAVVGLFGQRRTSSRPTRKAFRSKRKPVAPGESTLT